ncbi:unnamed protein product [Rhizophagus irregularis]|nr:unnamed protein product [Rhizophagus irregularis]
MRHCTSLNKSCIFTFCGPGPLIPIGISSSINNNGDFLNYLNNQYTLGHELTLALFVSLALLEIPYASDGSNNRKFDHCITVWTRKRKYYLDMKITNVILNELDIYKNSCFVFLRLLSTFLGR